MTVKSIHNTCSEVTDDPTIAPQLHSDANWAMGWKMIPSMLAFPIVFEAFFVPVLP
jgi:hypothetical protein